MAAPWTVNSSAQMPRLATVTVGRSARHMAPSAETIEVGTRGGRHSPRRTMPRCGAADLLLALDQELEVDRQPARGPQEGLGHEDRDQHRPLVVGRRRAHRGGRRGPSARTAGSVHSVQRVGRLHVVVAVDQDGRRAAGASQPLGQHHRMAARSARSRRARGRRAAAGRATHSAAAAHAVCVGRIGADARDAAERLQLRDVAVELGGEQRPRPRSSVSLAAVDAQRLAGDPAGIVARRRTGPRARCPRACRAASGRCSRSARCWPASPIASHCRSVVGLERTKPGATLLTVMPNGPSSCASWRVRPICPALALA